MKRKGKEVNLWEEALPVSRRNRSAIRTAAKVHDRGEQGMLIFKDI